MPPQGNLCKLIWGLSRGHRGDHLIGIGVNEQYARRAQMTDPDATRITRQRPRQVANRNGGRQPFVSGRSARSGPARIVTQTPCSFVRSSIAARLLSIP